jgi:nucleoside-diphosphate-sugar epimerase
MTRKGTVLCAPSSLETDLRSKESIIECLKTFNPSVVVNLAGVSFVNTSNLRLLYDINSFGQLNVLEALSDNGFDGKLIFAGSGNIYGNNTMKSIPENQSPTPVNHYSFSKVLAENFCSLYKEAFTIIITRPFSCIGVGQAPHFLVPKIVSHFRDSAAVIQLGNIEVERDFIDIRDIVSMYEILIYHDTSYDVIHFSNDETHSIREILQTMKIVSGHNIEVNTDPALVRPNDLLYQRGSNQRIKSLGYVRRHSLEDTLTWMYSYS